MLTIITMTNPRPSHPSPKIITQTILSTYIDKRLVGVRHIIAADGCPTDKAMLHRSWKKKWDGTRNLCPRFKKFLKNVFTDLAGVKIDLLVQPEAVGLGKNLKRVMDLVETPYVFVQQDDMPMVREFNMTGLLLTMEADKNIWYVRFGMPIIPAFDRNIKAYNKSGRYGVDLVSDANALDQNHVVTAESLRKCLGALNDTSYDFRVPEDIFYSEPVLCKSSGYLYGNIKDYSPMTHSKKYITHLDGRKSN